MTSLFGACIRRARESGDPTIRPAVLRIVAVLALFVVAPAMASSQTLITSASNVRLRSAPGAESIVVTMLPLGTELTRTDARAHGEWIEVRTRRGESGWIDAALTLSISDSTYPMVVRKLIAERLGREGDGFLARTELVSFVETVLERDWPIQDRAWLELQRLRALDVALRTIPFNRARWDDRVSAWVTARGGEIRYNEPGGQWLIDRDVILQLHDRYRSTAAGDELAWFAVRNGLPGECEGYLVCYLEWLDKLEGEYLRRQPAGTHVEAAVAGVERIIEYYRSNSKPSDYFDAQRECVPLARVVGSLDAAVRGSTATESGRIARELRDILRLCADVESNAVGSDAGR